MSGIRLNIVLYLCGKSSSSILWNNGVTCGMNGQLTERRETEFVEKRCKILY